MTTPLPTGWEADVLRTLGAPVSPNNVSNLDAWNRAEGGSIANVDSYNPFNTTRLDSGYSGRRTNSAGVLAFPDWATGLHETTATIEQQNMAPILAALRGDVPLAQFAGAVGVAPWNTDAGMSDAKRIAAMGGSTPTVDVSGAQLAGTSKSSGGQSVGSSILDFLFGSPTDKPRTGSDVFSAPDPAEAAQLAGNTFLQAIGALAKSGWVMRGTLVVVGLIVLFIGLSQLTKGAGAGGTVAGGAQEVRVHVVGAGHKAAGAAKSAGEAA